MDELGIPRDRLAHVLGMILAKGLMAQPQALISIVIEGEDVFVTRCLATDRHGISREEYRTIYRKLARKAKHMGLPLTRQ
jgi:hypothetical protein